MTTQRVQTCALNNLCKKSQPLPHTLILGGLLGLAILATGPAYADIYKITHADGSVVYSDRASNDMNSKVDIVTIPPAPTASAQTSQYNAYTAAPMPATSVNTPNADGSNNGINSNKDSSVAYHLTILSPIKERAYHRPMQNIEVEVSVSPKLRAGDKVTILIDSAEVATGLTASIPTTQLNPGKHILEVHVLTGSGVSTSKETMTFYVIQNSRVQQQKRQLVEQLNAYNQLPWYKKLMLRLSSK